MRGDTAPEIIAGFKKRARRYRLAAKVLLGVGILIWVVAGFRLLGPSYDFLGVLVPVNEGDALVAYVDRAREVCDSKEDTSRVETDEEIEQTLKELEKTLKGEGRRDPERDACFDSVWENDPEVLSLRKWARVLSAIKIGIAGLIAVFLSRRTMHSVRVLDQAAAHSAETTPP